MARKSAEFEVIFHLPNEEKGKQLLAKTIGEVHTKMIKEIINRKVKDISQKNNIILEVQKRLSNN